MKDLIKIGQLKLWQNYCDKKRKEHPLTYLFWECTLKCNLSCKHCGSSCGPTKSSQEELTTDEIKNAFKSIADDFDAKKIIVAVTGGEPLLRRDIFEVMGYASQLGFRWGMVTNGTLVNAEMIAKMKQAKISTISVSLDGLDKNHNWLRQNQDAHIRTTNGIKLLAEAKEIVTIEAITCVNQRNISELDKIYQLCCDLGLTNWRLLAISPIGRASSSPELFLTNKQMRYLLDFIKDKRHRRTKLRPSFCDEGFLGTEYEGQTRSQFFYCWAGISIGSILFNGDIGSCPSLPRKNTRQGNIRQQRFSEVWYNKYQMFRNRSWRKKDDCSSCQWWDFCEGSSLHLWNFDKNKLQLCHYNYLNKEDQT